MFSVVPFGPSQRSVCEPLTNSNGVRWKQASVTGSDVFLHRRYAGDNESAVGLSESGGARGGGVARTVAAAVIRVDGPADLGLAAGLPKAQKEA